MQWTDERKSTFTVLHLNKGDDNTLQAGHLGTELNNKAETSSTNY